MQPEDDDKIVYTSFEDVPIDDEAEPADAAPEHLDKHPETGEPL